MPPEAGTRRRAGNLSEAARRLWLATASAVVVGLVLRWANLGGSGASFDESFTGAYSSLPLGDIPGALRLDDSHPPLDYLIRHFFAGGHDTLVLRLPSAVFASLTLLLVAWWMRHRGWFGVTVVALTAVAPFQVLYAHQARLYALAVLAGTALAVSADSWRTASGPGAIGSAPPGPTAAAHPGWWTTAAGASLFVLLLTQSSALLVVPGAVALAGVRRDRPAWWWRAGITGALAAWAVVWAGSWVHQTTNYSASWIPFTSPSGLAEAVGGLLTLDSAVAPVAVLLGGVGVVLLARSAPGLFRLVLWLFVVPVAAGAVIGIRTHFLLARTFAWAAWAPMLAVGALVTTAWKRSLLVGGLTTVVVVLVLARTVPLSLTYEEPSVPVRQALASRLAPGDTVVVHPRWLAPLAIWDLDAPHQVSGPAVLGGLDAFVYVVGGGEPTGRVWTVQPDGYALHDQPLVACPGAEAPEHLGEYLLACRQLPAGS